MCVVCQTHETCLDEAYNPAYVNAVDLISFARFLQRVEDAAHTRWYMHLFLRPSIAQPEVTSELNGHNSEERCLHEFCVALHAQ
jgi:hypothetical protein